MKTDKELMCVLMEENRKMEAKRAELIKAKEWAMDNSRKLAGELVKTKKQRDALLVVCKELLKTLAETGYDPAICQMVHKTKQAIAQAESDGT